MGRSGCGHDDAGGSPPRPKVDFKRSLDSYRAKPGAFRVVDVPPMRYLMVDGHGDPNTSTSYAQAREALYPVAYSVKFASQQELGRDYVVPPLEGLWWAENMDVFTVARDKSQWNWTMMLMVPEWVETTMVQAAVQSVGTKRRPTRLGDLRLETLAEGRCVQTLHIGAFDDEGPVLARMHEEFIPAQGLRMTGEHHEVYFSDPRRTSPAKLRTLLRQPVSAAS
ncbi:GyrI-like domain-containing protein [Nesterenkonia alkaliphila]|uniref:GyrI-like small molecule binding domain-containing protein n=1 Tax=Nesterenkonia alkaliphila TaxID=1463631 RepID=A0A7K1UIX2_9MICC|nr:GyrI-like domain-containing protein [Nesterenkonia alkaliphila]MVT26428.1 hypothetical protein [Nesterenkonia alkaliphila]GFZ95474.1 hypothetical protein GCM10011359_26240 [Nesterenkonia alkaliphila]